MDHPRLQEQAAAQGVPFDAPFQRTMLGMYSLMQTAVAATVRTGATSRRCARVNGEPGSLTCTSMCRTNVRLVDTYYVLKMEYCGGRTTQRKISAAFYILPAFFDTHNLPSLKVMLTVPRLRICVQ